MSEDVHIQAWRPVGAAAGRLIAGSRALGELKPALARRVGQAKDRLIGFRGFQAMFLAWSFGKATWFQMRGNDFEAAEATLRYSRIMSGAGSTAPSPTPIRRRNAAIVRRCVRGESNYLLTSYAASREAARYRNEFAGYGFEHARTLKYPRAADRPDREGDLLVLKPSLGPQERGVLLVQYTDGIRKFASLYDVEALARRYVFVLEPSWWGYQEATLLMLLGLKTDVVVQAQYHLDYEYIRQLGHNMHPIALGAGDWTDPSTFQHDPSIEKRYDIVMVANWQPLKRHELLFRALAPIAKEIGRVALVGYPCAGRTIADIKNEAARHGVLSSLDFHESVPPQQVNLLLQQSRVTVMLTRREGANRAIYESLFSNVPVLVSQSNVGVNRAHINDQTGMFSSDEDLSENILRSVRRSAAYTPRAWALQHTGYLNSTRRLNEQLKALALRRGEVWTADIYRKTNRPHAMYPDATERAIARRHFNDLNRCLTAQVPRT